MTIPDSAAPGASMSRRRPQTAVRPPMVPSRGSPGGDPGCGSPRVDRDAWAPDVEFVVPLEPTGTAIGTAIVARPRGVVDVGTSAVLRDTLLAALTASPRMLVVDLTDVTLLDSTGLGALVAVDRRATLMGCLFRLSAPTYIVARVLDVTGMDRVWKVYPTTTEAMADALLDPTSTCPETPAGTGRSRSTTRSVDRRVNGRSVIVSD